MPLHISRVSRREMLCRSMCAGFGLLLPGCASYPVFRGLTGGSLDDSEPLERWALLSDTHISADPDASVGPVNMASHLSQAVSAVLATSPAGLEAGTYEASSTAGVIVNGDCALEHGRAGDYQTFADLLVRPMARAGVPVHLNVGNHDDRHHFLAALSNAGLSAPGDDTLPAGTTPVEGRCVSVIPGRHANWFLLDTLDDRYLMAGSIGRRQLEWLDAALHRLRDRPAIVVGHHPLDPEYDLLDQNTSLLDAGPLWGVLARCPHVKAYVFGHTHRWNVTRRQGVYLVNLPSTAYTFDAGQPHGWVEMWLGAKGARLKLRHVGGEARDPGSTDLAMLRWA